MTVQKSPRHWRIVDGPCIKDEKSNQHLVDENGVDLELWPHEYWYLAPSRVSYAEHEKNVRAVDFALALNNARLNGGVLTALDDLLAGLPSAPAGRGARRDAELTLERVRECIFPERPSRMRSIFLNDDKATAERRNTVWFGGKRDLVRCQVILNSGKFHHGDVDIYERLQGRPGDERLAAAYWESFHPNSSDEFGRLEVIADSMLYFPDWEKFPLLDQASLERWAWATPLHLR